MVKLFLLIIFIPFLACTAHYTIQRGVITGGAEGAAAFNKMAMEHDTCWVVDSTWEDYHVNCR